MKFFFFKIILHFFLVFFSLIINMINDLHYAALQIMTETLFSIHEISCIYVCVCGRNKSVVFLFFFLIHMILSIYDIAADVDLVGKLDYSNF